LVEISTVEQLYERLKNEPILENCAVLSYESGAVLEQAMYYEWAKRHDLPMDDIKVIIGKLKSELMDVMAQAWVICLKVGEDPDKWLDLGCEKAVDAIDKKLSGKLNEHIEGKW
jgi:hypothetical protein